MNGDGFPDLVGWPQTSLTSPTSPQYANAVTIMLNCGLRCTTTSAASGTTSILFGQPATFTATVMPANAKATGIPTGTVTFEATLNEELTVPTTTTLGSVSLSSGTANLTYSGLPLGTYIISASYQGDTNFNASTSASDPPPPAELVVPGSTTVALDSSADPSSPGQSVTLTATVNSVAPASEVSTGVVTFSINGNPLGAQPLNTNRTAVLTTSALTEGTDSITAAYSGDTNFASSTSSAISQIVGTNAAIAFLLGAADGGELQLQPDADHPEGRVSDDAHHQHNRLGFCLRYLP